MEVQYIYVLGLGLVYKEHGRIVKYARYKVIIKMIIKQ